MSKLSVHIKVVLLLIALCCFLQADAQKKEIRFQHYIIEQGLSQSVVTDIVQDTLGFMWFGTRDGLNKFDGHSFKVYRSSPGDTDAIPASYIKCLNIDSKGRFWIGLEGAGLVRFDAHKNSFISYFKGSVFERNKLLLDVNCIVEDKDAIIWVGTMGGLVRFNPKTGETKCYFYDSKNKNPIPSDKISSLLPDGNNNLWVGTLGNGLFKLNVNSLIVKPYSLHSNSSVQGLQDFEENVTKMLIVNSKLWVNTPMGLFIVDTSTARFDYKRPLPSGVMDATKLFSGNIFFDHAGKLLMPYQQIGLGVIDTSNWNCELIVNEPSKRTSLAYNAITCFYYDNGGNLWIGLNGAGVDKMESHAKFDLVRYAANEQGCLNFKSIRAIIKDSKGNLYVGGYGGLTRFDANKGASYEFEVDKKNTSHKLFAKNIYSLCEDAEGQIWIGAEGNGLQRYNPKTGLMTNWFSVGMGPKDLPDLTVYKLFKDNGNNIWIGTKNGLVKYDNKSGNMMRYLDSLDGQPYSISIRDICDDGPNALWVATEAGLIHIDKADKRNKFVFVHEPNNKNSINGRFLRCVHQDKSGALWLAIEGGGLDRILYNEKLHKIQVQHHTVEQGLPSNVVYGILEDEEGSIWASTNNGVCKIDQKGNLTKYGTDDGLQSTEFNAGAYYKANDGQMFFGGINGLNMFYPKKVQTNQLMPKVLLTGFKVFNKDYALPCPVWSTTKINLDYYDNFFSFEFAALDYNSPEKNEYSYKLEGFDNEWVNAGSRRYASYTNLAPGDYTFKVKATNSDGIWGTNEASIQLGIVPPFWRNRWFITLLMGSLIFLVALLLRSRISSLQNEQKKLEEKVKVQSEFMKIERLKAEIAVSKALIEGQNTEQKRISEDLHDGLGQTLTAASLNIMSVEDDITRTGATSAERLESLKNLIQGAIVEVRNISRNLMPNLMAEEGLEAAINEICSRTSSLNRLDVILKIQDLPKKLNESLEISFYRIIQEIINNTLKHSGARSLFISIICKEDRILLETEDNGIGFDVISKGSKGLGLKNIAIRVELLNGTYQIKSTPGKGTTITMEIPIV